MHSEGRYAELSIRAVCILDSTVRVNTEHQRSSLFPPHTTSNTAAPPVTSEQVVAGSPHPPACLSGPAQFSSCPLSGTRDQLVRAGPGISSVIKAGTWRHEHICGGVWSPMAPLCKLHRAHKWSLWNKATKEDVEQFRVEQESASAAAAAAACACVRACVHACAASLTNHKVYYLQIERAPPRHQLPSNLALPFDFHFGWLARVPVRLLAVCCCLDRRVFVLRWCHSYWSEEITTPFCLIKGTPRSWLGFPSHSCEKQWWSKIFQRHVHVSAYHFVLLHLWSLKAEKYISSWNER